MATTTPNYGWPVPTSTDYVKDGATAIEALGDAIDATVFGLGSSGLKLIKKQTIGSGVSTVSVTSAFSATYDNYRIMVNGTVGSTNLFLAMTLTGSTANYHNSVMWVPYTGGGVSTASLGTSSFSQAGDVQTADGCSLNVELGDPFAAKRTSFRSLGVGMATNGNNIQMSGIHGVSTSYTGFTLTTNTGTITGGTIYVYGYGTS
jgi:hypothetical protein